MGNYQPIELSGCFYSYDRVDLPHQDLKNVANLSQPGALANTDVSTETPGETSNFTFWAAFLVVISGYVDVQEQQMTWKILMHSREEYTIVEMLPSAQDYNRLRVAVGWKPYREAVIEDSLPNSLYCLCALIDGQTVGMARIIGDDGMVYYIQDVIVLREYQRRGIGTHMMAVSTISTLITLTKCFVLIFLLLYT